MPVLLYKNNYQAFPPVDTADDDGLLALSLDLHYERVLCAYEKGIFPWFEDWDYFYWFSPPIRCLLFPHEVVIQKSMRTYFNNNKYHATYDQCFAEVMEKCANVPRKYGDGTWINENFYETYQTLHVLGYAHSVEVWMDNELVGGLYGVVLGKVFSGESMFSSEKNASKFALISLAQRLQKEDFLAIDCQQSTEHIKSMGAKDVNREDFIEILDKNLEYATEREKWA
jgi:leucyl/phenylalanyl-tRNA---protein transferase